MKVYFIENENPYRTSSGGIMSYLMNLSKFLRTKNVETVLCGVGKENNGSNQVFTEFKQILPESDPSNYKYIFALFSKLKELSVTDETIIHAQRPDMLIPAIFFFRKTKLVCSLHGAHDLAVYDKKGFIQGIIYQLLQSIAFRFADLLIAVDKNTKDYYVRKYPSIKNKIKLIPIAVDTDKFFPMDSEMIRKKYHFSKKDKIIIFVGRIEKEKNVKFIIDSFVHVQKKIGNVKLLLVGSGRQEEEYKAYVSQKGIKDVFFKGEVANEIIPELLNCADVFAFSSLYEGSPTVIKEALACNIPIVSVNVGDVKSMINDLDGCFLAERDITDFSSKLINILNNRGKFAGRKRALEFNSDSIGQMTLNLYKKLQGQN
ncbi:MAG: glycosyltransferase family 4 protein [Candidatus Tenebribacter burtonii]|nr:glycosyltransferase family 4 protein [Candidatus Tenebribacter burtonii]